MASMSRLLSGSCRDTAGPFSPPLRMDSRVIRRRSPLTFFSPPWQPRQWVCRIGLTLVSKNLSFSAAVVGPSARANSTATTARRVETSIRTTNCINGSGGGKAQAEDYVTIVPTRIPTRQAEKRGNHAASLHAAGSLGDNEASREAMTMDDRIQTGTGFVEPTSGLAIQCPCGQAFSVRGEDLPR